MSEAAPGSPAPGSPAPPREAPKSSRTFPPVPSDRAPALARTPSAARLLAASPAARQARAGLEAAVVAASLGLYALLVAHLSFEVPVAAQTVFGFLGGPARHGSSPSLAAHFDQMLLASAFGLVASVALASTRGGGRLVGLALTATATWLGITLAGLAQRLADGDLVARGESLAQGALVVGILATAACSAAVWLLGSTPLGTTHGGESASEPVSPAPTEDDPAPEKRLARAGVAFATAALAGVSGGLVAGWGHTEVAAGLGGAGLGLALVLAAAGFARRRYGLGIAERLLVLLWTGPLLVVARTWGTTLATKGVLAYGTFLEQLTGPSGSGLSGMERLVYESLLATALLLASLVAEGFARRAGRVAAMATVASLAAASAVVVEHSSWEDLDPLLALAGGAVLACALLAGELGHRTTPAT